MSARRFLAPAAVVLAAVLVYAGSPWNGFTLDDHLVVESNPVVTGDAPVVRALVEPWHPHAGSAYLVWRPLTTMSFALQWRAHGGEAWAFHVVNVLLHALASLLAFRLARALVPGRPRAAMLAGVAFAVHAIHTDAVSSIVGRAEVLAACFAFASFLAWHRWVAGGGTGTLVAAGIAFLLGLLGKESAGPLPLFAAAWVFVARRRGEAAARPGRLLAGWAAAFALPAAAYAVARWNALDTLVSPAGHYFADIDAWRAFLTMAGVGARYVALLVVPWPLAPDYSFESIPIAGSPLEPWTAAGLVLLPAALAGATALPALARGRAAGAGLGLAWLAVFMLPASNVVPLTVPMAERLVYVGSAGACIAAGAALDATIDRLRLPGLVLAATWIVVLAALAADRDRAWRDDATLWTDAVAVHPRSALGWANLGQALAAEGRAPAAVAALHRALEVAPGKWEFRVALADILHQSGLHRDEADALREGARLAGGVPPDPARLCAALVEVGDVPDPTECVREHSALSPGPHGRRSRTTPVETRTPPSRPARPQGH
ncbi:MAG: tetratricopeptide repeat protein [Deltaproteobacteria bacterium]|nr:tetratricopeptide repeat protein [Deltaproteobacteria bacterium]